MVVTEMAVYSVVVNQIFRYLEKQASKTYDQNE